MGFPTLCVFLSPHVGTSVMVRDVGSNTRMELVQRKVWITTLRDANRTHGEVSDRNRTHGDVRTPKAGGVRGRNRKHGSALREKRRGTQLDHNAR